MSEKCYHCRETKYGCKWDWVDGNPCDSYYDWVCEDCHKYGSPVICHACNKRGYKQGYIYERKIGKYRCNECEAKAQEEKIKAENERPVTCVMCKNTFQAQECKELLLKNTSKSTHMCQPCFKSTFPEDWTL